MKDKKRIFSLAIVVVLILGLLPTFAFTAMAKNYEISVPSTKEISKSGWDGMGTLSVKDQLSPGEELKVYAGSTNSFYLVNQDYPSEKIHYVMNDEPGGAEVTSWVLDKRHRSKMLGIEVADFGSMPSGTYTDTVTFFGREESSKTLITPQTMTITLTITPPARKTEPIKYTLEYNGNPHTLIIAGEAAEGGIMQYQLGDDAINVPTGEWDVILPKGTEAKDYYVWYREYKGPNNYTQPRCLTVTITPISLEQRVVRVVLSSTSLPYTGSEQTVTVKKVSVADVILKEGKDYEVSGTQGTEPGTYKVTITGKGNYKDSTWAYFTIGLIPELRWGSQGEDVKGLQVRLAALGYYFGPIDGDFGSVTNAAVKMFQTANGLYVDGVVGPLTRKALGYQDPPPSQGSAPAAGVSLAIGSRGDEVSSLQQILTSLGYDPGGQDGYFGTYTEAAVEAFQRENGLYVDGVVGPLTRKALGYQDPPPSQGSAPAPAAGVSLAIGSRGDEVSSLQQILTSLGYNPGGQDGYFGTYTEAAVEAFQKENGLYVDGFVGPYTWEALNSGNAKPAPADVPAGKQSGSQTPTAPTTPTTPTAPTTPGSGDLVYGMTSGEIAFFQLLLSAYGYNVGAIDGYFGDQTLKAVKAFQKDFGLYVDGVIGAQTKAALGIIQ